MQRSEMLAQVNGIFIDILDNEEIVLTEQTAANDVEEWDSLTHIQLVVAVEKQFKIRFTSKEIQSWNNVGDMLTCLQEKGI
ncbi:MAG: acyl carrier protein [Bacteroidetes bacterium]|nr:acyl carrier protein [Bacteroidota bacterium]